MYSIAKAITKTLSSNKTVPATVAPRTNDSATGLKIDELAVGKTYQFKLKHWKHYQTATIKYIGTNVIVHDQTHPVSGTSEEFALNLKMGSNWEFNELA